jgi:Alpha/beta hydrolase domain
MSRRPWTVGTVSVLVVVLSACSSSGSSTPTTTTTHQGTGVLTAAATVTGPVTTGQIVEPLTGLNQNMPAYGYEEHEFFVSGTAHAFHATSTPANGRWTITPTTNAPYETRIIVRRPSDPSKFNGTVVVEWLNVSAGESSPDWDFLNPMLMREGFAYAGVSAQALAVQGGSPLLSTGNGNGNAAQAAEAAQAKGGLVKAEPARYGTLHHPGDQYALDIYDQVGKAVRADGATLLGGAKPSHVVAVGESQSAFYLTTYTDAIQPRSNTFDGIFIHSRGGTAAPIDGSSIESTGAGVTRIRTDLSVPAFMFETQTDLIQLGYAPARQPNTDRIRTWEVAGTSHADAYLIGPGQSFLGCTQQINTGSQHEVVQAAFSAFADWVDHGTPPPSPSPFRLASTDPPTLALDAHGNVVGGVRTPSVDVPISTLSGAPPPGASAICALFGSTTPFSPTTLSALYGSQANYVQQYQQSVDKAIRGGYLLAADRASLLAQAHQVAIP